LVRQRRKSGNRPARLVVANSRALPVHRCRWAVMPWGALVQVVQSVPLDQQDIECLIDGLRLVTPCTARIDRLVDLLEQIRDRDQRPTDAPS
jgi:hypothetical protein